VVAPAEALASAIARAPDDLVQAAGIANRERPQDVGIEDREGDRQHAETGGKRQHRRCYECRVLTHRAPGIAQVLKELLQPNQPDGAGDESGRRSR
jgi:hypothetical protein